MGYERAMQVLAMQNASSEVHYYLCVWEECTRDSRLQREIKAAEQRMVLMHNEQYERAMQVLAMKNACSEVQCYFSVWKEYARDSSQKQNIKAAEQCMRQSHSRQYERAMQVLAMQNASSEVHYYLCVWEECTRDSRLQREIKAAEQRMVQTKNEQYERAMQMLAMKNACSEVQCYFCAWKDCARDSKQQQNIKAAEQCMLQTKNEQYERAMQMLAM